VLGPLLFIIYINDLPLGIKHISDVVLFADDTSVLVADESYEKFKQKLISVISCLQNWFDGNQLVLNTAKTNFMTFTPANFACVPLTIEYKNILIKEVTTTKFLGMHIDTNMNWKKHIEHILPKLASICYVIRTLYNSLNSEALCMVYFACFHSVINYGLIFRGNSTNVQRVLRVQKKVIRIMSGVGMTASCRGLFRKLNILPVASQYIFSLMLFVVANQNNFHTNLTVHGRNTRNRNQFHLPSSSTSCFKKGVFYSGIRIFNSLPDNIRSLRYDRVQFRKELRKYLMTHSFYSLTEFFELNK
jgi:hypothetical protein